MASTAGIAVSYKQELLTGGIHALTDTYKIALYSSSATMTPATTTVYSTTNEVTGTGYTAGGIALLNANLITSGTTVSLDFDTPSWTSATITARYALIYNSSKANRAVCIVDFGADKGVIGGGTFIVPIDSGAVGID